MGDTPRCWPCTLLGRWQHGPLFWLLRWHLGATGRRMDQEEANV